MKYFAHKIKFCGLTFDSKTERDRYIQLQDMQRKGLIDNLQLQKEFELLPKQTRLVTIQLKTKTKTKEIVDERAVHYHCDFYYYDRIKKAWIIEEIKSNMTAQIRDYPLRRKLVKLMIKRMNESQNDAIYIFNEIVK